jgi:hypothetical protein
MVKAVSYAIVLRSVGSGNFVLDTTFLEVLLDVPGYVLTSAVEAESLNLLPSFKFCLGDKRL